MADNSRKRIDLARDALAETLRKLKGVHVADAVASTTTIPPIIMGDELDAASMRMKSSCDDANPSNAVSAGRSRWRRSEIQNNFV